MTGVQTCALPISNTHRNKLFTEKERELLFIDKIDKGIIYVLGIRVHRDDEKYYMQLLKEGRKKETMPYGNHTQEWEQQKYLNRLRRQKKKLAVVLTIAFAPISTFCSFRLFSRSAISLFVCSIFNSIGFFDASPASFVACAIFSAVSASLS